MIKEKGKSKNVFFGLIIFIALTVGITAVVYKLYNKLEVSGDFSKIAVNKDDKGDLSIYKMYEVVSVKAYEGYYVTFIDVIADADSIGKEKHYFNIAFTAHVRTKENAKELVNNSERIVKKIRNTLINLRTTDIGNSEVFEYVRNSIRLETNSLVNKDNVLGIYFESFLSQ